MIDLSTVHLSNHEMRALRRLRKGFPISSRNAEVLRKCGFAVIRSAMFFGKICKCRITDVGTRYLDVKNLERADRIWNRSLAVASVLIATAALVVSVLSLLLSAKSMQAQGLLPEWIKLG